MNLHRWPEIDAVRGVAVVAMVLYHLVFDVVFIFNYPMFRLSLASYLGWSILAGVIATTFLLLVGLSLTLSLAKAEATGQLSDFKLKVYRRALFIFSGGLLLTVITYVVAPGWTIWFGILQLIGVSLILSLPFLKNKNTWWWAVIIIFIGWLVSFSNLNSISLWWLPLGIHPANWQTLDYYPLLPWWGVVLLGIAIGRRWYPDGLRGWHLPETVAAILETRWLAGIRWLGRHALLVYFIHQPLLLVGLWLTFSW